MNTRSISFRLVAWYAGLLSGIFLLLCAMLYLDLRHFLEKELRESQLRRAHQIASTLLVHVKQTGESYVAGQTKDWYEPEINDRFIRITRADGSLVYASGAPKDGSFNPAEVPALPRSDQTEFYRKLKLSGGKTLLVAGLNFQSPGEPAYLVEFGALLDPVETMLNHLFLQLSLGLPLAIIIIAVGGYLLVRRALTPVEQITRAAERITQHNLSGRLPVSSTGDELERLSVSLNRMITRLDDAFQNSKRFVADASHDLRTPLTILRGELENFSEDGRLDSELRDRVGSMLEEVVHLGKIVEQLFTLSRLDAGEAQTEWTRFDLSELAQSTTEQMNLLAEDKGISISCDAAQPLMVEGNRVRLKQVVVNLLDNAIKYTPAKGAIQLRVHGVNSHAVLEVKDSGIGIPPDALPHIFERFYRVDPARSAESESAGLGLSIVKSICAAHGAEVEAQSSVGNGSRFRVKLPLSKN
ncbi:MAG TPA: ATP-binding protein [Candidatus Baltobacteraceae bacterium]|nr:ATP-binding protein [Candidatus Baltobacteraceae bacterium]